MNYKKTWFGYLNFILASVFTSLCIIAAVYSNLEYKMKDFFNDPSSTVAKSTLGVPGWLALLIGAFGVCAISQIFYLIRKFREHLYKKKGFFATDLASERIGGFISFLIFAAGLFLRAKAITDKFFFNVDVKKTVNSLNIQALFDKNNGLSFVSFEDFYDSLVAIIYKFSGIKEAAYMWLNFALHIVLILLIYCIVMHIYNAFVAIVPMLYICLYPDNIKLVVSGGYENCSRILIATILLIAVLIIGFFRDSKNREIINLIFVPLTEALVLIGVSMAVFNEFGINPAFSFSLNKRIFEWVLFENIDYVCLIILIFMLLCSLSFFFSSKDRLTAVFPVWIICAVFFVFSKSAWSSGYLLNILTAVFAGIGFEELLVSKLVITEKEEKAAIHECDNVTKENVKEIIVKKPETSEISPVSDTTSETGNIIDSNNDTETKINSDSDMNDAKESSIVENISTENNQVPQVELFESPLPLPKKHKKKDIEFKFEPEEDKMNFDVDILENDDFDV